MHERLARLLNLLQLSPSQAAEQLNVQRSTFSHILKGRNKPSFDLIQKILNEFTKVNPDWLILGKGEVFREDTNVNSQVDEKPVQKPSQNPSLFEEESNKNEFNTSDNSKSISLSMKSLITEKQKEKELDKVNLTEIVHIYSDGSFKHYIND